MTPGEPEIPLNQFEGRSEAYRSARRETRRGIWINLMLASVKGVAGFLGGSFALIADAAESALDVLTSSLVYVGLRVASAPPTPNHPYGKGRAETLAGLVVAIAVIGAAIALGVQSVIEIMHPQKVPATWTLAVLGAVIAFKEYLYRRFRAKANELGSISLQNEAWHHRSDAITSLAAGIGILIALVGGPRYAAADDWAALVASLVILYNGWNLLQAPFSSLMDARVDPEVERLIRETAMGIEGVRGTHHCRIRKHGFDYFVDLDIRVDGAMSVMKSHDIAHLVQDAIRERMPLVHRVLVHVEPEGIAKPADGGELDAGGPTSG
ncbi:MAG: cation transporter [Fimbriimonadaceae bacterium]|nr:cation transporter [Fimbriimonadaceae bacterium]